MEVFAELKDGFLEFENRKTHKEEAPSVKEWMKRPLLGKRYAVVRRNWYLYVSVNTNFFGLGRFLWVGGVFFPRIFTDVGGLNRRRECF